MKPSIELTGAMGPATRGQRVVPLPLALVALTIPLLAAWAWPGPSQGPRQGEGLLDGIRGSHAEARTLDEPFVLLGRDVRVPEEEGGYVDVWAEPKGWEVGVLRRADQRQR